MPQPPDQEEDVRPWNLTHVVTRTVISTTIAASRQSRWWWVVLAVTIAPTTVGLALANAPPLAYGVPLALLLAGIYADTASGGP